MMKIRSTFLLCLLTLTKGLFSQVLYSSINEVGTRYNFGIGKAGTPKVAFDDVSVENALIDGLDSITVTKVNVGIRRTPGAPATDVRIYYTPFEDTSTQINSWTKTPPVLLGTVSLPANGSSLVTTVVAVGDATSALFKMKANTNAVYSGYHTFFIGTALSNPDPANALRFTSGPTINRDYAWIYDADSSASSYAAKFDNVSATFYIKVFGGSQSLLPIKLSEFSGKQVRGGVNELTWSTETELNNKGFELQRSADGITFSSVSFISTKADKGGSTSKITYQYVDNKPLEGSNYYRLKQLDNDGRFVLSKIILVKNDKPDGLKFLKIYPNPVASVLYMSMMSTGSEKINIDVTDFSGKAVIARTESLVNGVNNLSIDVTRLAAGTYSIKVTGKNGTLVTGTFIRQ